MIVNISVEYNKGSNGMDSNFASHRSEKRGPSKRTATIKLGLFKSLECAVEDLSASGAKLVLSEKKDLPEHFDLVMSGTGRKKTHKCVNRWQNENSVGVEFLSTKIG